MLLMASINKPRWPRLNAIQFPGDHRIERIVTDKHLAELGDYRRRRLGGEAHHAFADARDSLVG